MGLVQVSVSKLWNVESGATYARSGDTKFARDREIGVSKLNRQRYILEMGLLPLTFTERRMFPNTPGPT